jgi:hypothetical protein
MMQYYLIEVQGDESTRLILEPFQISKLIEEILAGKFVDWTRGSMPILTVKALKPNESIITFRVAPEDQS